MGNLLVQISPLKAYFGENRPLSPVFSRGVTFESCPSFRTIPNTCRWVDMQRSLGVHGDTIAAIADGTHRTMSL